MFLHVENIACITTRCDTWQLSMECIPPPCHIDVDTLSLIHGRCVIFDSYRTSAAAESLEIL